MKFISDRLVPACLAAIVFFVLIVGAVTPLRAAPGDLVAVCFNADGNDDFAIIALTNIVGGTRYFLTDSAWSTSANDLIQEGSTPSSTRQIQFDVAAGGIPFGTVIKFSQAGGVAALVNPAQGTLTMVNRFSTSALPLLTNLSFGSSGDQLLIYQTAGNTVGGAVTMVSAFNNSVYVNPGFITIANGWQVGTLPQTGQTGGTAECNAPAGLIVYDGSNASTATAFGLGSFAVGGLTGLDNYKYNGTYSFANKTAALTAINNPANWVADDVTPYDLATVGPTLAAEINVQQSGTNIVDGSTTAQSTDGTLFGAVPVTSGTFTRTFTIQNLGTANLVISNATISGANAADFAISGITLPLTLTPSGSTTFVVTFDPSAAGIRNATVNIANTDSNENPYDFAIQGIGLNYTAPAGSPPPFRWSSLVQSNNAGTVRGVGGATNGDIIAVSKVNSASASNLRVTRYAGSTGTVIWTKDIDNGTSDDANDIFVDAPSGDVYIAAAASTGGNLNWYVNKVNGNGSNVWTYIFDGAFAGADECRAITRASDGNIVAVGYTTTAAGFFARAARLNASTGSELNAYVSPVTSSQFNGVAADASGNVYATGTILTSNQDGITVKLSATLGLVWSQTFDGSGQADSFSQVAVHPASGDCVVGGTTRTSTTNLDDIVIRYAAASPGTEAWRRVIAGAVSGSEAMNNLVVDASGDFYVAGAIRNTLSTDRDAFVSKITGTSGAVAWTAVRAGSSADSSDRFQNVRVFGGSVYAVGNLDNATRDIFASRFNASTGVEDWTLTFNGSGNGADDQFSNKSMMTVLDTNSFALGGETFDVSANTYGIVLKYAPNQPPTLTTVSKTLNEDTVLTFTAADFTGNYSDPENSPLTTVRITSPPASGVLRLSGSTFSTPLDIPIANIGNLTYTPNLDFNVTDGFGWNGSDGSLFAVNNGLIFLTVREVNDAPTGVDDVLSNVFANSGTRTNSFASLLANDSKGPANESAQTLTITSVGSAVGGVVNLVGTNVLFTPTLNYTGPASYVYTLQDNGTTAGVNDFKTDTATASFNILPVAPGITCPGNITTNANGFCPPLITFAVTATGVPTPVLSYKIGATPITSPFAFPVGTSTVTSTATNSGGTNTCSFNVIVTATAAPQLAIVRTGTNVVVSWSNIYPCYTFEFAPVLASNTWGTYAGPFVTNNGKIFVTNSAPFTNRFFRLKF